MADIVYPGQGGEALNATSLPSNNDLVIYKGDYLELFVTLKDYTGTPLNLSGSTPAAALKSDYSDRAPNMFECTLTGTPGQVRIFLSSEVTSTLIPGSYIWDFQVTSPTGQTKTYLTGDVTVYNDVTS